MPWHLSAGPAVGDVRTGGSSDHGGRRMYPYDRVGVISSLWAPVSLFRPRSIPAQPQDMDRSRGLSQ